MKTTTKSEKKFQIVMHEFGQGELKSHGKPVTDQKQALAIAFSEARKIYPNYGMMKKAGEVKDAAVKGLFSLDAIEGKKFPGYTFGDDWNGWATPYFESTEANAIAEALGGRKVYDKPSYFLFPEHGEHEGGWQDFTDGPYKAETIKTVDGDKYVFPIGAYNWTWDNDLMRNGGGINGPQAAALAKIYKTGTARELWEAWTPENRTHFLMDHAVEFFEIMGDDYTKSANGFSVLSYDTIPSPIKKSVLIHHAQGMYAGGGGIGGFWKATKKQTRSAYEKSKELAGKGYEKTKEGYQKAKAYTEKKIHDQKRNIALDVLDETRGKVRSKQDSRMLNQAANLVEDQYANGGGIPSKLSPSKKKLLDRINTLKATKDNAGAAAQKAIQKKIDVLQKQFDYNPSAKERAMDNKGRFALDVPAKYSKAIYKKLWSMKVFPKIHTLNGTSSIVVSSKLNLDKAYMVFSDLAKEKGEKASPLSLISRKL